ncbi:MAG TPA: GreA/GreB family elongation factor [Actinomycetota bacterium]|nr:GreA/GreB family elongation factor [Actinomycetota bacterium]
MEEPRTRRNAGEAPSAVLTREAYERLREELERLTGEGRRRMAERLQHARELGDIRENAEYDAAKNEQGLMEARIRELERILKDPDLVDAPEEADTAAPGVVVTVRALEEEEPEAETYLLAASKEERFPGARTVSVDSPFGRALLGRGVGERVSYQAPGGMFSYEILGLRPRG